MNQEAQRNVCDKCGKESAWAVTYEEMRAATVGWIRMNPTPNLSETYYKDFCSKECLLKAVEEGYDQYKTELPT